MSDLHKKILEKIDSISNEIANKASIMKKLRKEYDELKIKDAASINECVLKNKKLQDDFTKLELLKEKMLKEERESYDLEMKKQIETEKAKLIAYENQIKSGIIKSINENYAEAEKNMSKTEIGINSSKMDKLNSLTILELIQFNDILVQLRLKSKPAPQQQPPSRPVPAPSSEPISQPKPQPPPLPNVPPGVKISRPPKLLGSKAHHYRDFILSRLLANGFDYRDPEDRKLINMVAEACECYPLELKVKTLALKISASQDIPKKDLVNQLLTFIKDANLTKKCVDNTSVDEFPEGDRCTMNIKYSTQEQRQYYRDYLVKSGFDPVKDASYYKIIDESCGCSSLKEGLAMIRDKIQIRYADLMSRASNPQVTQELKRKIQTMDLLYNSFNKENCSDVNSC
jgi:hypothetical protein